MLKEGFSGSPMVMNLPANARDVGLIPWSGRSSEERNSNSLHYSCLGNPMDRGVWWATVHEVARVGQDLASEPPQLTALGLARKQSIY